MLKIERLRSDITEYHSVCWGGGVGVLHKGTGRSKREDRHPENLQHITPNTQHPQKTDYKTCKHEPHEVKIKASPPICL